MLTERVGVDASQGLVNKGETTDGAVVYYLSQKKIEESESADKKNRSEEAHV